MELDEAIGAWTRVRQSPTVLGVLDAAAVPCGPILNVRNMVADAHYQSRGMFERVRVLALGGEKIVLPALCPKLERGGGKTEWAGPEVGEHTSKVLGGVLGLSDELTDELSAVGAIGLSVRRGRSGTSRVRAACGGL